MQAEGIIDIGQWLVDQRRDLDRGEGDWLEALAAFDDDGGWALDGHFCCATWLVWRTDMARSTAFEKLRVAHELRRRPVVAAALREGRISYSAARAITRMNRPAPEVDQALVDLASTGQASIHDVERVVRSYQLYADQDQAPADDADANRDVRIVRRGDGTGQLLITLTDIETEQFAAALQAFLDRQYRPRAVDESSAADSAELDELVGAEAPLEEPTRSQRKADALMDLLATALAAADDGHAVGDDRYLVHLVSTDHRHLSTAQGDPLHPIDAATITCDCATVIHTVNRQGEPLNLGRKTRQWNTAQRRAITIRDGGHCRFPGCPNTHVDIHHMQSWDDRGATDIANGLSECRRHHRLLHAGYQARPAINGEVHFYRPNGTYLGSSHPSMQVRSYTSPDLSH